MDNSIITNNKEIIFIKVGKGTSNGFYALIDDVIPDPQKKGWWIVIFYPLVPTKDCKLIEASWILNDAQIRGEEFTMKDLTHQLCKIQFPNDKTDADSPVPLPSPIRKNNVIPFIKKVKG